MGSAPPGPFERCLIKRFNGGPAIRLHCASRHAFPGRATPLPGSSRAVQARRRGVYDSPHPNSTDARSIFLSRNYNQCLAFGLAAANTFLQAAQVRLVYLDSPGQAIPVRAHHGASQFMQPRPSRLVTLQSQHPLKAHGARTVLLAGDPPDRPEPERQGLAGILKDRPCRHRTLVAAARTLQQNVGYWPTLSPSTARATESLGPAEPKQILPAGRFRREPSLEFQ